jgi:cell division GTPase FtsZ
MNVLLLSTGGGGANILRSLKALFDRDVAGARQTDTAYAERLQGAVTTRFLDTNEFSLAQARPDERVLIGPATTRGLGSRHSPELALQALEESRHDVEQLMSGYAVIVLIGTGGKGTGAGTMFPLAQMARRLGKLVLPVFVRPSFDRHEVDKRRYDHALQVVAAFDAAQIRLIEILNDRAYSADDPQPQEIVWERMNLPIARGLRGLLYVLWDLSQVDPSDLSILLAGPGRVRIGFGEVAPGAAGDPSSAEIAEAVHACWQNAYYAFSRPVGTSLICIQGDWSNLADASIKGGLATLALADTRGRPYNPLYARATPKPWGVTALFTEFTGVHEPIALDWTTEKARLADAHGTAPVDTVDVLAPSAAPIESLPWRPSAVVNELASGTEPKPVSAPDPDQPVGRPFDSVWDFVKALTRSDRLALEMAAGAPPADLPVDSATVRRLLATSWFRTVFGLLSDSWRGHMLDTLNEGLVIPNHALRLGRHNVCLADLSYAQVREISAQTLVRGAAGADLQLLLAIGQLWGESALRRLRFVAIEPGDSLLGSLFGLHGSRSAGT